MASVRAPRSGLMFYTPDLSFTSLSVGLFQSVSDGHCEYSIDNILLAEASPYLLLAVSSFTFARFTFNRMKKYSSTRSFSLKHGSKARATCHQRQGILP